MRILPIKLPNSQNISFGTLNKETKPTQETPSQTDTNDSARALELLAISNRAQINKTPAEVKKALDNFRETNKNAKAVSQSAAEEAQTVLQAAAEQIEKILADSKKIYGEINKYPYYTNGETMEDISLSNNTSRKTTFFPYSNMIVAQEGTFRNSGNQGEYDRKFYFLNGMLQEYLEGFRTYPDGTKEYSKRIEFVNGEPHRYFEGCTIHPDGTKEYSKRIEYTNCEPYSYTENETTGRDGISRFAKGFYFEDGLMRKYIENYQSFAAADTQSNTQSGSQNSTAKKISRIIDFKDGQLNSYMEDVKLSENYSKRAARMIEYENGQPSIYKEGNKISPKRKERSAAIVKFDKNAEPIWYSRGNFEDLYRNSFFAKKYICSNGSWIKVVR